MLNALSLSEKNGRDSLPSPQEVNVLLFAGSTEIADEAAADWS
jgi:hypothetical protein